MTHGTSQHRPPNRPSTHQAAAEGGGLWARTVALLTPDPNQPVEPDSSIRRRSGHRIAWLGTALAVGFLALSTRASTLMVLPDPRLERRAKVQFEQLVEIRGRRGDILDRSGAILATTVELRSIHVDPARLDAPLQKALVATLVEQLHLDAEALTPRLSNRNRRDVRVAHDLTPSQAKVVLTAVKKLRKTYPNARGAVWAAQEQRRFYPERTEAGPLLGLVNNTGHGAAGLEESMDDTLSGQVHKYVQWRDRKGRRITPDTVHVEAGDTIVLSLDRRIQHFAEEAILEAVEETRPLAATATVVDVHTGELLAIVNWPNENPNNTTHFDVNNFKNRAAADVFEPGSVFKPFVAAAALKAGLVRPDTPIDCEGGVWTVGRRRIHDDHPHGVISVSEVIKFSSNIGAAKLALRLGAKRTLATLSDFGFGRTTALGLPGERSGVLRNADTIKPIELATTAYGHGVSATSMQLAYGVAALANDGTRMKPLLVKEIRDASGRVIDRYPPQKDVEVVSPSVARAVIDMMTTVTEKGGTGTRARIDGYLVAGKTGTAWKYIEGQGYSSTARIGSFVGMVPADDPRLAIAVSVDTPTVGRSYGGIVAAPAFAAIGGHAMRVLGVAPDPALIRDADDALTDVSEEPVDDGPGTVGPELTWTADQRLRTPNLRGLSLRDTLITLQGAGLDIAFKGSGAVLTQEPPPGARVVPGDTITVVLQ